MSLNDESEPSSRLTQHRQFKKLFLAKARLLKRFEPRYFLYKFLKMGCVLSMHQICDAGQKNRSLSRPYRLILDCSCSWTAPALGLLQLLDCSCSWTTPASGLILDWSWTDPGLILDWSWTDPGLILDWSCSWTAPAPAPGLILAPGAVQEQSWTRILDLNRSILVPIANQDWSWLLVAYAAGKKYWSWKYP